MPDFIAVADQGFDDARAIENALADRPGMEGTAATTWSLSWGTLTVQDARCHGYRPYADHANVTFSVGRPRRVGWESPSQADTTFSLEIRNAARATAGEVRNWYGGLTGMFALASADACGITLFTDRLGSYPVYRANSSAGRRMVLGTHPELVAALAGREEDWDLVSLAEIILRESITYPYTTRHGMTELAPGRRHRFEFDPITKPRHHELVLWEPREPESWPSLRASREELEAALRLAGEDITRGCRRTFVTLSGGTDSRTVLAAIPPERRGGAVTFCDRENTETRVAALVAETAGVKHHRIFRDPEFYADLAMIEPSLLGIERGMAHSHGVALVGEWSQIQGDLLLDGFLSDTLLKSHVFAVTPGMIGKGILGYMCNSKTPLTSTAPTGGQSILMKECVEAIFNRLAQREAKISTIRPASAQEWARFYPVSRRPPFSYAAANARLFPSDQLFLHRDIVEVASKAHWIVKGLRLLTPSAFAAVCGETADLRTADKQRPMSANYFMHTHDKVAPRVKRAVKKRTRSARPRYGKKDHWFTDGSWIDFAQFQRASPRWQELREECGSAGAEPLQRVLQEPLAEFLGAYREDHNQFRNFTLVKLARYIAHIAERKQSSSVAHIARGVTWR